MRFQSLSAAVMAAAVSAQYATTPDCPQTCLNAYNTCRGAPDSNKSLCASQYAGCLGYNPFGSDGSLITPTACSVSATSAPSVSATPTGNVCASTCSTAYNTCRGAPDSNKSLCASQYASCLGYNPFGSDGSLITPTACSASATSAASAYPTGANACAAACSSAYNTCRGAPDSNKSFCASQYSSCLGYSPFGADGSLITPVACAIYVTRPTSVAMTTSTVYGTSVYTVTSCAPTVTNCPAKVGQVTTEVTILYTTVCPVSQASPAPTATVVSQVTSAAPAPTTMTTSAASAPSCPAACYTAYNACRGAANSNKAGCASQYAGCLGYNPFGADGSLITPTACSAATSASSYGTIATKPTTTSGLTQFTGAADSKKPLMGLLALGALALL